MALIKDIPELTETIANVGNLSILSIYRNPAINLKNARVLDATITGLCLNIIELVVTANQAPPPDRFETWLMQCKASESTPVTPKPSPFVVDPEKWQQRRGRSSNKPASIIGPENCWNCRTCLEGHTIGMFMVVCPECGNKRCPKATDHRENCTNSNDPGQPGSDY